MSDVMSHTAETTFARRDLLKGGGALIVGFAFAGAPSGAALAARGDVAGPFEMNAIDTWIAIHADNTATIYLGKGEFGQGNTTGLLQMAAEELDFDMSQVRSVPLGCRVWISASKSGGVSGRPATMRMPGSLLRTASSSRSSPNQTIAVLSRINGQSSR